jgi:predicted esterase
MVRSLLKSTLSFFLASILLLCGTTLYLSYKEYSRYFQTRHGSLKDISVKRDSTARKFWITLSNDNGFKVDCGLLIPQSPRQRSPAIVLLGGKATGKYAIDYALDIDSVIILALDYPYEPRSSYTFWTILQDVPAVRNALIDMVPASMLAMDYLCQRTDVDTAKIVILGYSFGAPFVPVIVAHDRRYAAAAMVYGGGELTSMIRHNVRRYEGALLSEFVGRLGGLLLRPLEPMLYAEKITPIPLVMINGARDEQVPRVNTKIFYQAAKEPKKIVYLDSKHVNPGNPELTRRIIAVLKEELKSLHIL